MKRILVFVLCFFALVNTGKSQNSLPKNFVGIYQWCFVRCETIKINNDFTFEFLFEKKDIYKGTLSGKWKIIGQNKIKLEARDEARINELEKTEEENKITIDPAYPTEIDYEFVFRKKKLCKLFNSGIYACYKKLNYKKSQNLFSEQ